MEIVIIFDFQVSFTFINLSYAGYFFQISVFSDTIITYALRYNYQ
jgi:hypothetical protein